MRIGIISTAFPNDLEKSVFGLHQRFGMFVQAMKQLGTLELLFFVPPGVPTDERCAASSARRLARHWSADLRIELCPLASFVPKRGFWHEYVSPALSIINDLPYAQTSRREQVNAVERLLASKPDLIFVHRLHCMVPLLLSKTRHPSIHFDMDDVEHIALMRSIRQPPSWRGKRLQYLRVPTLRRWERRAVRVSRRTYVCSEHDRQVLADAYGGRNVVVVPNAVNLPKEQALLETRVLLFLGRMSYQPNAVSADYLIRKIWPTIRSAVPDARLVIAGERPERIESFPQKPEGVDFLGFVSNLDELYKRVMVVCCPIVSGGGTRVKILEAAAYGKPVVSTTMGAEGLDLRPGQEILLGDDPESFAQACIRLLRDGALGARLGQNARVAVSRLYDRHRTVNRIKSQLDPAHSALSVDEGVVSA